MGSFEKILDLLFPPRCPLCGKLGKGICPDCDAKLPLVGQAQTVRRVGSFRCAAPLWYEGVAREGLLRLKFRGTRSAARSFGELLARCAAEEFSGEFDVVTWVPVSKKRLRKRGFDQARLLAEEACRLWGRSPERLLVKIADNPPSGAACRQGGPTSWESMKSARDRTLRAGAFCSLTISALPGQR